LTRFQANANLEGGGANLVCRHDAGAWRRPALQLEGRKYPVIRLGVGGLVQTGISYSVRPESIRVIFVANCDGECRFRGNKIKSYQKIESRADLLGNAYGSDQQRSQELRV
jgi:hypothetical protein